MSPTGALRKQGGARVAADIRVSVDLVQELDAGEWARRHAEDEVPDHAPYGLDRLTAHGVHPHFRESLSSAPARWFAGKVRNRAGGVELVEALAASLRRERRTRDAVLCMDERTGIAATLVPGGTPVVSGLVWIDRPERLAPAYRALVQWSLPRLGGLWTYSSRMVPMLQEAWGLPSEQVHLLPLGIDADFYPEQPWPERGGLVVSAGEDRGRDHALLVEAVRRVRESVPGVHLELASSLPVAVDPALVTVHRQRLNGAMRELYRRSTVVAVAIRPTPVVSGLTVVLEAMASGSPIVVTANPGIDEYVEHGVSGLLVRPGDPDAFATALRELLSDPDRVREMGRNGRAAVERGWTTDHMAARIATVIRRAL